MLNLVRPNRAVSGFISLVFLMFLTTHYGTALFLDFANWGGKVLGHVFAQSLSHLPLVGQSGSTAH